MNYYKALNNQIYSIGDYSIVPIRYQDRFEIMKWRNEQIYHLRQKEFLTENSQEKYFAEVVSNLFKIKNPDQLLFSFLKNNNCIGYGGLVKINWINKNAEISFLMNTNLEKNHFEEYWLLFLKLIEQVGFSDISLNKIYTYAFDLRPQLYPILLKANYLEEARLKNHCFFQKKFIDVLIHSKFNIKFREANLGDINTYFIWVNDPLVRATSYNTNAVTLIEHKNENSLMLLFEISNKPIGQVRFEKEDDNHSVINISISSEFRGNGYGSQILKMASNYFHSINPGTAINAYIKTSNISSVKSFEKASFKRSEILNYKGFESFNYKLEN